MTIREELESVNGLNIVIGAIEEDIPFNNEHVVMYDFGTIDRSKILEMDATMEIFNSTMSFILYGFLWKEYLDIEGETFPFERIYMDLDEINKVIYAI